MSSFSHRRVMKGYQYLFMAIFNPGKGSTALMYRLRVLVTAASMPGASCATVVGHRSRVSIPGRLSGPPVDHRSCAPCRHGRHTAPVPSFARCIGWRETQFAQHCAQGDVHLHVGEPCADTTVDAAAERNPRGGLRTGADESARVERRRVREALF